MTWPIPMCDLKDCDQDSMCIIEPCDGTRRHYFVCSFHRESVHNWSDVETKHPRAEER